MYIKNKNKFNYAESILEALYREIVKSKDRFNEGIISHLYGVVLKFDPKKKGESLSLLENSRIIKENYYETERSFYIELPKLTFNSDFNEEIKEYIKAQK